MKFSIATARMPYGRTFEIKRIVTGVIAGCNEDGVAQFLRKEYEQKLRWIWYNSDEEYQYISRMIL